MAGTFTHLIISDFAKADKAAIGDDLWQLLNRHYSFLFLGSVSPDLPYLSFKTGSINWADVMHYEKTNSNVQSGHKVLKESWADRTLVDEIKLAWLLGYVSHLVIDATIHPIVQAIVGTYQEHKTEHRLCEMTQDPLLYYEKRNDDLKYDDFSEMIRFCKESEHFDALMDFWANLLRGNYPEKGEDPHPSLWFKTYSAAIDAAEGDNRLAAIFRHVGIETKGFIYRTKADIEQNYPQELTKYYAQVRLPNGNTGFFEKDGYERALINVATAWKKLYDGLSAPVATAEVIRNWNLDTGVDMDSPNQTVTYWG